MTRDSRYDILFEPVPIGPVTARNRFYQVPHCSGMGHSRPAAEAAMRAVKAEGGWAVVCTPECEIHPSSEFAPYTEARLWDARDLPALGRWTEAVHAHGALAGIELAYNGHAVPNRLSRVPPFAPSARVVDDYDPVQARAMDKSDIRNLRTWHRRAALRARAAGFDIVYVYAGHNLALPMHFLSSRINRRGDEYGGSLANRARLLRELIEDTKEAVGEHCAVAVRLAVDELLGPAGITCDGEGREVLELLAELPDLWDVNVSDWANDSQTSRFSAEGFQEPYVAFVKQVTSKPVVGVGRFTSPDAMVAQIRRGVLDLIGAARPSIADPFLPRKIEQGRGDEIRECIGCNVCVSGDFKQVPMRCTQNPTIGEEWRSGWHPERIPPARSKDKVLVIGAGPAGLECARALGQRGYPVLLAEADGALGGRVSREAALPGLAAWARVRDWRIGRINDLARVEVYPGSRMTAADVRAAECRRVVIATGAHWRRDGSGRYNALPVVVAEGARIFSPDELMAGVTPPGPVMIYDDDHNYLGGVLAELLVRAGREVCLVTPAPVISRWTEYTLEQGRIQRRLIELGVETVVQRGLVAVTECEAELECVYTGARSRRACAAVVMVTARDPDDGLYHELRAEPAALAAAGIRSLDRIGDCLAPGLIAAAVWSGHRLARGFDEPTGADTLDHEVAVEIARPEAGNHG